MQTLKKAHLKILGVITTLLILSGCSSAPSMTKSNVAKIKPGMSTNQVYSILGYPSDISTTTCAHIKNNQVWSCIEWTYGSWPLSSNFYFQKRSDGNAYLTHYKTLAVTVN